MHAATRGGFTFVAKNNASTASAQDNLGGLSNPEKKISANVVTVADKSATVKGGRYCFYGICNNSIAATDASKAQYKQGSFDIENITSANVRTLTKSALNGGCPTTLAVPMGSTQVLFAVPANKYTSLSVTDSLAMNAPVTFYKKTGVAVEGAIAKIGETSTAINYDIWYVTWGDPIASDSSFDLVWG
jgi:hypothetical protein